MFKNQKKKTLKKVTPKTRALTNVWFAFEQLCNLRRNHFVNGIRWMERIEPEILIDGDTTLFIKGVILGRTTIIEEVSQPSIAVR